MQKTFLRFLYFNFLFFCSNSYCIKIPSYYKDNTYYTVNFEQEEKPLVVVVCTYNNAQWFDRNLQSIFDQKYSNYRVIIVDDCSSDGTGDLIEKYIKEHNQENRCTLIKNTQRKHKMANLYRAIHTCENYEIIVEFDGDDWFLDNRVFSYINELYSSSDTWLTYGGYQEYPSGKPGFCRQIPTEVIDANSFRSYYRTTSQQRTFYAALFKHLPLEDLFFEGKFFKITSDVAQMMPMFELAGHKIAYNYRKLYVYNLANAINDHKVDSRHQTRANDYVLGRRKLNPIESLTPIPEEKIQNSSVDVVIVLENPSSLSQHLLNLNHLSNYSTVNVIANNASVKEQFEASFTHKNVIFSRAQSDILPELINVVSNLKNEYIFFMNDSSVLDLSINLREYVSAIEKTGAFAWYCKKGVSNINDYCNIENDIFALQFGQKNAKGHNAFSCNMSLYRKKDILSCLKSLTLTQPNFENCLNQRTVNLNTVALFTPMN